MKAIHTFAACAFLLSGAAIAAPATNGTVKGTVNGKRIDVKTVCEREKMGSSDWLYVKSDPGGRGELKDRDGDGIAVEVSINITDPGAAFTVLVDGREYTFGKMKGLQLTPNRLSFKGSFGQATKVPQPDKNFDVDLTVDCP